MINAYNYANRRWDRYGAYYSENEGFVSFETGETMFIWGKADPSERRFYAGHNVTLSATGDDSGITYLHPVTGKKIPKAHLTFKGTQYLLLDHDTNKAVGLGRGSHNQELPKHLTQAAALVYADKGKLYGSHIHLNAPEVVTQEMIEWRQTVLTMVKLKGTAGLIDKNKYFHRVVMCNAAHIKIPPYEYIETTLKSWHSEVYFNLLYCGIEFTREPQPLEYLAVDFKK